MKKIEFNEIAKDVERVSPKFFAVIVDLGLGELELIVNTIDNFESKMNYYNKIYDENMCHAHAPISIIDLIGADDISLIGDVYNMYLSERVQMNE